MKIHEYQAKELFRKFGIPVPDGSVAFDPDQAYETASGLGRFPILVKAQVHAGGRGQAGGVKTASSAEEARNAARQILGMTLVTPQTGPAGRLVRKILVEAGADIAREIYLGILPDRKSARVIILAGEAGGMNIEEIARQAPEKMVRVSIDPLSGLQPDHVLELAAPLKLSGKAKDQFADILTRLYKLYDQRDCSLLEINPLALTADHDLLALDAKIEIDNNALFRQPEILGYRDLDEENPLEVEAREYGLNYIKLDGNVGSMVNGAGLAMATMDMIKAVGAEPANFLDVGGGASAKMIEQGFRLILSDKKVRVILINIFGGILRCDVLAAGVVEAVRKIGNSKVPVVIRMEGTNVEEGRKILAASGLDLIVASDLNDAAAKVAELVK